MYGSDEYDLLARKLLVMSTWITKLEAKFASFPQPRHILLINLFVPFIIRLLIFRISTFFYSRLTLPLSTIKIYCNENRSRTFISLAFVDAVSMNQQYVCDIVARLDQSLGEFNLPSFYKVSFSLLLTALRNFILN